VSLVIPALSYINTHLIIVFTLLLCINFDGFLLRMITNSFDHCLENGLIN
jgi:hypothetical protein